MTSPDAQDTAVGHVHLDVDLVANNRGDVEYGLPVRHLFLILLNKWWVVLVVLLVVMIAAGAASRPENSQSDPFFESKSVLQIGTLGANPDGYRLPSELITTIASRGELLGEIIDELDLQDNFGDLMSIQSLRGMISSELDPVNQMLLTTIIHGSTPEQADAIFSKWSELFIESLSALDGSREYELIVAEHQVAVQNWILALNNRIEFERDTAKNIAELTRSNRDEKFDLLQSRATTLSEKGVRDLDDKNQLVVERRSERLMLSDTLNLKALQVELNAAVSNYQVFLNALVDDSANLINAQERLVQNTDALANETPVIIIERGVSDTALLSFLVGSPTLEEIDGLMDLVFVDEERNDLYYMLILAVLADQTEVAVLQADIDHANSEIARLDQEINRLNIFIGEQELLLDLFDQETIKLLAKLDKEAESDTARYNEVSTRILTQFDDDLAKIRVEHNASVTVQQTQIDYEISRLLSTVDRLDLELINTNKDGGEDAYSVQVIENSLQPTEPIPEQSSTQRSMFTVLSVGGVIGLLLGVMAAFAVYYAQRAVQDAKAKSRP